MRDRVDLALFKARANPLINTVQFGGINVVVLALPGRGPTIALFLQPRYFGRVGKVLADASPSTLPKLLQEYLALRVSHLSR